MRRKGEGGTAAGRMPPAYRFPGLCRRGRRSRPEGIMPRAAPDGVPMEIQTTRFGLLSVDETRVMTFPNGLLGFPPHTSFALLPTGQENYFFWLQSVNDPNLAFVVTDPSIFFKDYDVPLREETARELQVTDPAAVQTFVICNKVDDWLTGNLLGPLVINVENRRAQQVVLPEKKGGTRQPLLRLQADIPLAKSA